MRPSYVSTSYSSWSGCRYSEQSSSRGMHILVLALIYVLLHASSSLVPSRIELDHTLSQRE